MKRLLLTVWILAQAGCALAPGSAPPAVAVPAVFRNAPAEAGTADPERLAAWWRTFGDPELDRLIERAAASNLDLQSAAARVEEARALARVAGAALGPELGFTGSYQRIRGGFTRGVTRIEPGGAGGRVIAPFETDIFQLGFDAAWEIDLFGRLRYQRDAALAEAVASDYAHAAARVSVLAEVGRSYFELRGWQRRLAVAESNVRTQRETVDLTRSRVAAGLSPQLDLSRATAQLAEAEAEVPPLRRAIATAQHRLAVLLGLPPEQGPVATPALAFAPPLPERWPLGQPPELLTRRPDVRRAELLIAAAAARVGSAEAEHYPKLLLNGVVGRQATRFEDLRLGAGNFFAVGPSLSIPLFTTGRIRAAADSERARFEQARIAYEQTVLTALEDVENALTAWRNEEDRNGRLRAALAASRDAEAQSQALYRAGVSDFLDVLDAQRSRQSREAQLVSSDTERALALVALYKALGGGWKEG